MLHLKDKNLPPTSGSSYFLSITETIAKLPGKALDLSITILDLVASCLEALVNFLDYLRFPQRALEERKIEAIEKQNTLLEALVEKLKERSLQPFSSTDTSETSTSEPVEKSNSSEIEDPMIDIDSLEEEKQSHIANLHEFAKRDTDVSQDERNAQNTALEEIHPLQLLYFSLFRQHSSFAQIANSKYFPEARQRIVKIRIVRHLEMGPLKYSGFFTEGTALKKQFCEKTGISEKTLQSFIQDFPKDIAKFTFSEEPIPPESKLAKIRWLREINNSYPQRHKGALGLLETVIQLQGNKRATEESEALT